MKWNWKYSARASADTVRAQAHWWAVGASAAAVMAKAATVLVVGTAIIMYAAAYVVAAWLDRLGGRK